MELSDASKGQDGETIRDYTPMDGVTWRYGLPPDYETVNAAYFEGRTKVHPEGSLESIVQLAIKNWEVESHHIEVLSILTLALCTRIMCLRIFFGGESLQQDKGLI